MNMKTGLFTGSFDPFTIGHADIVARALPLFDRLVIGVVEGNVHKSHAQPIQARVDAIRRIYAAEPRVAVVPYSDLAVDLAQREQAGFIVKGVRSVKDFEYEHEMGEINRRLSGVETVLFLASPELAHISSSLLRELQHYGRDISAFLPQPVTPDSLE